MNSTHYKPTRAADRTWEFTTPMGVSTGFFSEPEATRAAQRTEAADRTCALNDQGPLAKVLLPHFLPETQPPA